MYIYGKTRIDKSGRILLSDFFSPEETPKEVVMVVDTETEQITVYKIDERPEAGPAISLDGKNRLFLPKWLREELEPYLNEGRELFFVYHEGKRYLSAKSGRIL